MAEWSPPIISGNWWHRGAKAYSLTPALWKSDGLPLTQLWLILSDYITLYRSLVGSLKRAHWFLIRTPLNTSRKEPGKYNLQLLNGSRQFQSLALREAGMVLYQPTAPEVPENRWHREKKLDFSMKRWKHEAAIWSKDLDKLWEWGRTKFADLQSVSVGNICS